jgi:hypothetical protein
VQTRQRLSQKKKRRRDKKVAMFRKETATHSFISQNPEEDSSSVEVWKAASYVALGSDEGFMESRPASFEEGEKEATGDS